MAVTTNRKQLHKHALPIVVLCTGLFIVSVIGLGRLAFGGTPPADTAGRLLTARWLRITPASNGLFHVSRYQPAEVTASQLPSVSQPAPLNGIANTGKVAELDVTLNALAQQQQ